MFQCIIQQRNGWIHVPNQEYRDVFPGKYFTIETGRRQEKGVDGCNSIQCKCNAFQRNICLQLSIRFNFPSRVRFACAANHGHCTVTRRLGTCANRSAPETFVQSMIHPSLPTQVGLIIALDQDGSQAHICSLAFALLGERSACACRRVIEAIEFHKMLGVWRKESTRESI